VETGDSTGIVTSLQELYDQGYEAAMVAAQLGSAVREAILTAASPRPHADLQLLQRLLDVPAARNARHLLEIILLEKALPPDTVALHPEAPEASAVKPKSVAHPSSVPRPAPSAPVPAKQAAVQKNENPIAAADSPGQSEPLDATELWQETLNQIKQRYNTLYGIARMAKPEFDGETLTLAFKFAFHQKRMNEAKNRKIFAEVVEKLQGRPVEIVCIIGQPKEDAKPDVSTISNIFGGAELLES
jgi:hypothetical protein